MGLLDMVLRALPVISPLLKTKPRGETQLLRADTVRQKPAVLCRRADHGIGGDQSYLM
ncbi:MAG: hypothetical protein SH859_06935 [Hyphomicrobium aestuarii]|nr:hypothetical protein [Hyphomicrobium aestuarii]